MSVSPRTNYAMFVSRFVQELIGLSFASANFTCHLAVEEIAKLL